MRKSPDETAPDIEELDPEELVAEDDRVIGRAFGWSIGIFVAVAAVVAIAVWIARRPEVAPPAQAIPSAAPERVVRSVEPPRVPFADVAQQAGLRFMHFTGAYGDKLLPETMGGGVAFFDFDQDGDQDLLLVNGAMWSFAAANAYPPGTDPRSALYLNDGKGSFTDASASSRIAELTKGFQGMGVATADWDADGWIDVFLTGVGRNILLRNRGGVLEDRTSTMKLVGLSDDWATGAGFFDMENDGDLDLFVCNYVRWSKEIDFEVDFRLTGLGRAYGPPQNYQGTYPRLWRNDGERFTDVSEEAGIQVKNPATGVPVAKALGLAPIDVDGDRAMDLLVANDTVRKFFYHNRGNGTFEEVGEVYGLAYDRDGNATGAMGVDVGHYRNDADLGFFISNFANEMTSLYVSTGDPTSWVDEAIGEGIGAPSRRVLKFGLFLFDYDLDGRLDVLQANGHLEEEIEKVDPSQQYRQSAQLFWNAGDGGERRFELVPTGATGDLGRAIVGRGAAYADMDADGDLDVALTQVGGPPLLLRNDQETGHHWLRVKLVGAGKNRDAIGAWIELTAGGVMQRRQVMPTRSYLSQVELPVTFGLGKATTVERLEVVWPDGERQVVAEPGIDRVVVVQAG